ncbi:MAG: Tll0287-like domain-containing protein [Alphaproteobacteria bacterium]
MALVTAPSAGQAEPDLDEYRGQARILVKQFAGSLRNTLLEAIAEGDLDHAIRICKTMAPEVARSFSQQGDWLVHRTALRVRNPDNAPTPQEMAVLVDFQARAEQGEKIPGMEHTGVTKRLDKPFFHYMRAIPLGGVCAQCHGKNIDPDLALLIRGLYPEDRATGFEVGDLRGAFTLYKPLP